MKQVGKDGGQANPKLVNAMLTEEIGAAAKSGG